MPLLRLCYIKHISILQTDSSTSPTGHEEASCSTELHMDKATQQRTASNLDTKLRDSYHHTSFYWKTIVHYPLNLLLWITLASI